MRHSSSPLGSTGSSNESWPLSKDEDMYNNISAHHNDEEPNPNLSTEDDDDDDKDGFINDEEGFDSVILNKPFSRARSSC